MNAPGNDGWEFAGSVTAVGPRVDPSRGCKSAGNRFVIALLLGATVLTSTAAIADRGRGHGGHGGHGNRGVSLGIGVGLGLLVGAAYAYPRYYYPPVYYPPVVVVPAPPPVYVERYVERQYSYAPPAPAAPAQPDWYYCADSQAYYPHARECPSGWQRVTPHPSTR